MWWLSFVDDGVIIMDVGAASLTQARTLAVINGIGRASKFEGGHFINPEHAVLIPNDMIGRLLSPPEAQRLRALLGYTRREPEG